MARHGVIKEHANSASVARRGVRLAGYRCAAASSFSQKWVRGAMKSIAVGIALALACGLWQPTTLYAKGSGGHGGGHGGGGHSGGGHSGGGHAGGGHGGGAHSGGGHSSGGQAGSRQAA